MGLYNQNDGERQYLNDPETGQITHHEIDTSVQHRIDDDDDDDLSNDMLEEEMNIDISFDDSSILWDLRQLFDPDFLVRTPSPYPRGDSADIPIEVMRAVTPVHGDGCLDENNMNIVRQRNQNNNCDSNNFPADTCLKNLTQVIHNSDQIKDLLFSPMKDRPSNNASCLVNNILSISTSEPEPAFKEILKDIHYPANTVSRGNNRPPRKYVSRRKKRYSSSSSSSSSESSCSCSTKRRKRHSCRYTHQCHNNNTCQHQCNGPCQVASSVNNSQSSVAHEPRLQNGPLYTNYLIPQSGWTNAPGNFAEISDMPVYQYTQNIPYIEPTYYSQPDMSDIIERIHKLDLNIEQLTKGDNVSWNCHPVNNQDMRTNDYLARY